MIYSDDKVQKSPNFDGFFIFGDFVHDINSNSQLPSLFKSRSDEMDQILAAAAANS